MLSTFKVTARYVSMWGTTLVVFQEHQSLPKLTCLHI